MALLIAWATDAGPAGDLRRVRRTHHADRRHRDGGGLDTTLRTWPRLVFRIRCQPTGRRDVFGSAWGLQDGHRAWIRERFGCRVPADGGTVGISLAEPGDKRCSGSISLSRLKATTVVRAAEHCDEEL